MKNTAYETSPSAMIGFPGEVQRNFRVLVNGSVVAKHRSLDDAWQAASARARTAGASGVRVSIETDECAEIYSLFIVNAYDEFLRV